MESEEALNQARQRAEKARQLLDDPLLKETFDLVSEALLAAVKSSKTEAEAYKGAIALQVFDLLKNQIRAHIETGKVMEFNLSGKKKIFGLI